MPRYKLTLEYDGTGLAGWQRQPDRLSVQELLEEAIFLFCGERTETHAAGRTDAGVHARAMVVHVDISKEHKEFSVQQGINHHLMPHPISILQAEKVPDDFHARYSAKERSYLYRIVNRSARIALDYKRVWHIPEPLDAEAMHEAAQSLVGHYDFSTFRDSECQAASALKTLDELRVTRIGEEIQIRTRARSFLHHQVRNMVGSLRLVGNGKWKTKDLETARDAADRTKGGETAPAHGLYFMGVKY